MSSLRFAVVSELNLPGMLSVIGHAINNPTCNLSARQLSSQKLYPSTVWIEDVPFSTKPSCLVQDDSPVNRVFVTVFWTMCNLGYFWCVWLRSNTCGYVEKVKTRVTVLTLYSFGNIFILKTHSPTHCLCSAGGECSFIVCQTIIKMCFDNHFSWVSGWPQRRTQGSAQALDLTAFDKDFSLWIKLHKSQCS